MMRKLIMAGIAMMTIAISSCSEDTATLGDSLTSNIDKFKSVSQSYQVHTKTIRTDSVLAYSLFRYLGKIKDPETGAYITGDYMTQFNMLENESTGLFPNIDDIAKDELEEPIADSCVIRIMINSFQGDSLAAMKLRICELAKPVPNSSKYYSDFDPEEEGYLRTTNAINLEKMYTVSDLTKSDSLRNVLRGNGYYQYISIPLTQQYIDKNENIYDGYDPELKCGTGFGTYLLRSYYDHPEYFKNSNVFARNVCPGFYVKSIDGQGCMVEVASTQIIVYYNYMKDGKKVNASRVINSTEEVLQTNHIINDKETIKRLEKIDTCTFLKTPAALFTEVTLPIDSIKWYGIRDAKGELIRDAKGDSITHMNDTIMSAKLTFQAMRYQRPTLSGKLLEEPTDLLMVPLDRLYSFFETNSIPDNITTYLATYNSTQRNYSFNSLTNLINSIFGSMKPHITNADGSINQSKLEAYKKAHPNWNKVVLVPIDYTQTYSSSSSSSVSSVFNSMAISSVRLVGGPNSKHGAITMSVMFNKNE